MVMWQKERKHDQRIMLKSICAINTNKSYYKLQGPKDHYTDSTVICSNDRTVANFYIKFEVLYFLT